MTIEAYLLIAIVFLLSPLGARGWGDLLGCTCKKFGDSMDAIREKHTSVRHALALAAKWVGKVLGIGALSTVGISTIAAIWMNLPEWQGEMTSGGLIAALWAALAAWKKFRPAEKGWDAINAATAAAIREKFDDSITFAPGDPAEATPLHVCRVCGKPILLKSQECGHEGIGYRHLDCHSDKPIHAEVPVEANEEPGDE